MMNQNNIFIITYLISNPTELQKYFIYVDSILTSLLLTIVIMNLFAYNSIYKDIRISILSLIFLYPIYIYANFADKYTSIPLYINGMILGQINVLLHISILFMTLSLILNTLVYTIEKLYLLKTNSNNGGNSSH